MAMGENDFMVDLGAIRRQRGVSLAEIAASTRISTRYLRAIESGEFEKLPGGVYNINYIRQYARAIDFSEDDLLQFYRRKARVEDAGAPARVETPVSHSILARLGQWITFAAPKYSHR